MIEYNPTGRLTIIKKSLIIKSLMKKNTDAIDCSPFNETECTEENKCFWTGETCLHNNQESKFLHLISKNVKYF